MKTMLGGFADGGAPPVPLRRANPIIPAAAPRRSSRRVIGSLRANMMEPPLRDDACHPSQNFRPALRPAQNQPVEAAAQVTEVGLVSGFQFGNGASCVANFSKRIA